MSEVIDTWELRSASNKDLTLSTGLDYFGSHFVGVPMASDWQTPEIEVIGKSKRLRDFVSWMTKAPVLSERAVEALGGLIEPHCEILPLLKLRGRSFYAVNVLTMIDCIDRERSSVLYSTSDNDRVLGIKEVSFLPDVPRDAPIFKWPHYMGHVFVTRPFVDVVVRAELRGAVFLDPAVDPFYFIVRSQTGNCVEGYDSDA